MGSTSCPWTAFYFYHLFTEEAVQEVKRQAMLELHKAVAATETKANEMVTSERLKMERKIEDIRKQTRDEIMNSLNQQEESSEVTHGILTGLRNYLFLSWFIIQ